MLPSFVTRRCSRICRRRRSVPFATYQCRGNWNHVLGLEGCSQANFWCRKILVQILHTWRFGGNIEHTTWKTLPPFSMDPFPPGEKLQLWKNPEVFPFSMDPFPPGKKCNFEKIPKFPARSPRILSLVEKKCNFEKIPKIFPTDPFPPGKKVQLWKNPEDFPRSPRILSHWEKSATLKKNPKDYFPSYLMMIQTIHS